MISFLLKLQITTREYVLFMKHLIIIFSSWSMMLRHSRAEVSSPDIRTAKRQSAAWRSGLERRFYDGHDRKVDDSTPTKASLLRPWIRCFTTVIPARWNLTSSNLKKSEAKFKRKTRKQGQLLSESGFVLCRASPSLYRDRKIKMKKSSVNSVICYASEALLTSKC